MIVMSPDGLQFETPRGVSKIEVRHGFAQIHINLDARDLPAARVHILRVLAEAGVSHKYLQLTQSGLALVIAEDDASLAEEVLKAAGVDFTLSKGRSLVLVHAVGMREEPGMIATILQAAIASGVQIDHIGDMHNKMFLVVQGGMAEETAQRFRSQLKKEQP